MTCKLKYTSEAVFGEVAETIHREIEQTLLKDINLKAIPSEQTYIFKPNRYFNSKNIIDKYGNVLLAEEYITINATNSKQYLDYVATQRIYGVQDYRELSIQELIEQDKTFSSEQLEGGLRKIYQDFESKYENPKEYFAEFIKEKNVKYQPISNNQFHKGYYYENVPKEITQRKVILPIGTSGSGKSTWINTLPKNKYVIISPDDMRVEFTGDINDKSKDIEIYEEVKKRTVESLNKGKDVIIDSTNLQKERRRDFLNTIKSKFAEVSLEYKLLPLNPELAKQRIKTQIERGESRANVPDTTIDRHALLYKEMLEDIKEEPLTVFQETNRHTELTFKYKNLDRYIETLNYDQKILLKDLLDKLSKVAPNFKIELLDKLLENGDSAVTDFRDSVIKIGRDADFTDITEEIFHVLVESIDDSYLADFEGLIERTQIYQEVVTIYGKDPRYDSKKLKREAIVKLVTQLSNNTPVEKFILTTNEGVIAKIKKAINKLFNKILSYYKKLDYEDFYDLTEAIMYNEVPYVNKDLTKLGEYASRKIPIQRNALKFTTLNLDLEDQNIPQIVLFPEDIVGEDGYFTDIGQELFGLFEANRDMSTKSYLSKIKILIEDAELPVKDQLPNYAVKRVQKLIDYYPKEYELFIDTIKDNNHVFIPRVQDKVITIKGESYTISEKDKSWKLIDSVGEVVEPNTIVPNMKFGNPTQYNLNIVRYTNLEEKKSSIDEAKLFFESVKESELFKKISKFGNSIEKDIKHITSLGLVNRPNVDTHAINVKLFQTLKTFGTKTDLISQVSALHSTMGEFKAYYNSLEKLLRSDNNIDLKDLRFIRFNVNRWEYLIEEIEKQLQIERDNNRTYDTYESYLDELKKSAQHLKNLISVKEAQKVQQNIIDTTSRPFNESLNRQVQELEQRLAENPELEKFIKPELDAAIAIRDQYIIEDAKILSNLLQTEQNDIDTDKSSYDFNPLFDRYLVNIRFSDDPILASFGQNIEDIYNQSDLEIQVLLSTLTSLGEDITSLGGEKKIGKLLTELVTTYDYQTRWVTEIEDGQVFKIKETVKVKVQKKQIINQWGNKKDYKVAKYGGTYGDLLMDIANTQERLDKGMLFKQEGEQRINLKEKYDKLVDLKYDFQNTYFHNKFKPEYYQIEKNNINRIAEREGRSVEDIQALYDKIVVDRNKLMEQRVLLQQEISTLEKKDKELIIAKRGEIGRLTNLISNLYSHTEGDLGLQSEILKSIRDQRDLYYKQEPNVEVFLRDLKLLAQQISDNEFILGIELQAAYQDAETDEILPLDEILTNLTRKHLELNTKSDITESELFVRRFLDESIWYKPTEEFYEKRAKIYNKMTLYSLFFKQNQFKVNSFTNETEANLKINSLNQGRNLPVVKIDFSNPDKIGEYLNKPLNTIIRFEFSPSNYIVFELDNGKPIPIDLFSTNNKLISDNWEKILSITKKYRDKFGYIYTMSDKDQLEVIKLEQEIYNDIALIKMIRDENVKLDKPLKKNLQDALKSLAEELDSIQQNIVTETYYDTMRDLFANNNSANFSWFKKVINSADTDFFKELKDLLFRFNKDISEDTLKKIIEDDYKYSDFIKEDWIKSDVTLKDKFADFNEADFKILQGILKNHVTKTHLDTPTVVPAYNYRKVIPTNIEKDVEKNLDNLYKFKEPLKEFTTEGIYSDVSEYRDYKGEYQLLEDPTKTGLIDVDSEQGKLIQKYKELQSGDNTNFQVEDISKLQRVYKEWVENNIIKTQRDIALGGNYKVAGASYLGYNVPYLAKQYSELGLWEAMKAFWEDVKGKRNTNETGDFAINPEGGQDTSSSFRDNVQRALSNVKDKKNIFDSLIGILTKWLTASGESKYKKDQKHIPVDYTQTMNGQDVTDNIFFAHANYMASLVKAKHISQNMYKINSLRDVLATNDPFDKENKTYKRREILEKNINSEIYRNNIGVNNPLTRFLRIIKRLMVYKSQSGFNIVGNFKNFQAGLLQNYIHSLNVPDNLIFDKKSRIAEDISSTASAFMLAWESWGVQSKLSDETLTQFLARHLNPQARNIKDLVRNSDRYNWKNLIFEEKIMFGGLKVGETIISYQLMLDIVKRIKLKDGENEISFLDSFEKVNGMWKMKEGLKDAKGVDFDLSRLLEIKKLIDYQRFETMGHSKHKGTIFNNSYVRSLFFFVNYLVPLMQNTFTLRRKNFYTNQVIENFNMSFAKFALNSIKYMLQGQIYWKYMSEHNKRNSIKAIVTYSSLYSLVLVMKYLFNFDPDEKDAYKKLKDNSNFENFLLVTTLRTASEIEQLSVANPLSNTMFPVITANYQAIRNPTLLRLLGDLGKAGQLSFDQIQYELGYEREDRLYYTRGNKNYGIKAGDSKLLHHLHKSFNPINTDRNYNYINQIRILQELGNK